MGSRWLARPLLCGAARTSVQGGFMMVPFVAVASRKVNPNNPPSQLGVVVNFNDTARLFLITGD